MGIGVPILQDMVVGDTTGEAGTAMVAIEAIAATIK